VAALDALPYGAILAPYGWPIVIDPEAPSPPDPPREAPDGPSASRRGGARGARGRGGGAGRGRERGGSGRAGARGAAVRGGGGGDGGVQDLARRAVHDPPSVPAQLPPAAHAAAALAGRVGPPLSAGAGAGARQPRL